MKKRFINNIKFNHKKVQGFHITELSDLIKNDSLLKFPYTQDFYSIIYIEKATGLITIDEFNININSKQILIIKPYSVNYIKINSDAKGKVICFTEDFFSLRYNNNILNEFSFIKNHTKPFTGYTDCQHKKMISIITLLCNEWDDYDALYMKETLRSYLNILLFEFERCHNFKKSIERKTLGKDQVSKLKKLIKVHYRNKKAPSDYAFLLNMTTNHLNKICKQELGKTTGSYIGHHLCIESQRLLQYTNKTINEIAIELGYKNTSYFSTFFKKQTGNSPEVYRKSILSRRGSTTLYHSEK